MFSENIALSSGGAIYVSAYDQISVLQTTFNSNYASINGGDIYALYSSEDNFITLGDVEIYNCSDTSALYLDTISLTSDNLLIYGNYD